MISRRETTRASIFANQGVRGALNEAEVGREERSDKKSGIRNTDAAVAVLDLQIMAATRMNVNTRERAKEREEKQRRKEEKRRGRFGWLENEVARADTKGDPPSDKGPRLFRPRASTSALLADRRKTRRGTKRSRSR